MTILTLPKELQHHIIGLLSVREQLRLSETCHGLNDLVFSVLKKLVLKYEQIKNNTKACRSYVARCSNLQELCIIKPEGGRVRSDKIMSVVMKAKNTLSTLSMDDCALSNASFKNISQMTQLTKLEFNKGNIKSDGIASIANLSELRFLKIVKKVDYVELLDIDIASNDPNFLSRIKNQEEVEIRLDQLNDTVIKSLVVNNPNLLHLNFSRCFITKLSRQNPRHHPQGGKDDIIQFVFKCSKLKV